MQESSDKDHASQGPHTSRWSPWFATAKRVLSFESEADCPQWMQEWLLFVQTWALYYALAFGLHQLATSFCDCRVVLMYFHYEVTSAHIPYRLLLLIRY